MKKNRIIKESPEDWIFFTKTIVDEVKEELLNNGQQKEQVDELFNETNIELDVINNQYTMMCNNKNLYSAPGDIRLNEFIINAEKAIYQWADNILNNRIKFNESIKKSVKNILKEASNSQIKKKYINLIYKNIKDLTSKFYRDSNWEGVSNLFNRIENVIKDYGELDIWVENGGYWKSYGEFPNYKEYKFAIQLNDGPIINGSLKCHAAGTMEDTFDKYDITVTLY